MRIPVYKGPVNAPLRGALESSVDPRAVALVRALENPGWKEPLGSGGGRITNTGYESFPYIAHESRLPMMDFDVYTPKDVHRINPGTTDLGEVLELLRQHAKDSRTTMDVSLTPGGVHATDMTEQLSGRDFPKLLNRLPLRAQELHDEGYAGMTVHNDVFRRRGLPKQSRSGDFIETPFQRIEGGGQVMPSSQRTLDEFRDFVDFTRPPDSQEGLKSVMGWHEQHGGLRPQDQALLRALFALGLGGVAVGGEDSQ